MDLSEHSDYRNVEGWEFLSTTGVSVGFPVGPDMVADEQALAAIVYGHWRPGRRHDKGIVLIMPIRATPYMIEALLDGYLAVATVDDRAALLTTLMDVFDKER